MPTKQDAKNFLAALKRTRKHQQRRTNNIGLAKVELRGCVAYGKGARVGKNLNGYPSIVGREMRIVRVYKNNR